MFASRHSDSTPYIAGVAAVLAVLTTTTVYRAFCTVQSELRTASASVSTYELVWSRERGELCVWQLRGNARGYFSFRLRIEFILCAPSLSRVFSNVF